jgi:hypothetical protein
MLPKTDRLAVAAPAAPAQTQAQTPIIESHQSRIISLLAFNGYVSEYLLFAPDADI